MGYIEKYLATPSGFTLTGKPEDLLPCYNAMLVEALSKLGYAHTSSVQSAVDWSKRYQPFARNTLSAWTGRGTKKYGGCLKQIPCFIGIAKTVKALVAYDKATGGTDTQVKALIEQGMQYILQHELYKRLSTKEPINSHMLDLAFPASYQLNVVELLQLALDTGYNRHPACASAIDYVTSKKTKDGGWKINYVYKSPGYVSFDARGKQAEWLTYTLNQCLG